MTGPCLVDMLSGCSSFWVMLQLPGNYPLSRSLLPSSSLPWSFFRSLYNICPLQTRLFISLATKIKNLRDNIGVLLPTLFSETFSWCVITALLKWTIMKSKSASLSTTNSIGANVHGYVFRAERNIAEQKTKPDPLREITSTSAESLSCLHRLQEGLWQDVTLSLMSNYEEIQLQCHKIRVIENLHDKAQCAVLFNGSTGDWVRTTVEVRQWLAPSPTENSLTVTGIVIKKVKMGKPCKACTCTLHTVYKSFSKNIDSK